MRIVIDLQFCQHGDGMPARAALALAQQLVRSAAGHTAWIAFSNQFPARLALLRAAFNGLLPADRVLVYDTPPADGSPRVRRVIELIRNNFFAALGADLVFAPGLSDGHGEAVGSMSGPARPFLTAVGCAGAPVHDGSDWRADLLLAATPAIAAALRVSAPGARVVEIGAHPLQAAQAAWETFEALVRERPMAPPPTSRPTLAYVCASPLAADVQDEATALARFYDVHLVAPASGSGSPLPAHDLSWFERHAAGLDRIVYRVANSAAHAPILDLLARHPGIVDLHDFFLGEAVQAQAGSDAEAGLRKTLFDAHGYAALAACATPGAPATPGSYPLNRTVLDAATGVIVRSPALTTLADAWYGEGSSLQWHVMPAPGEDPEAAARAYADAVEAFATTSPAGHYRSLLRAISALGLPADPCHPELVAAAQAIAANQPPARPRQLLVDVSSIVQIDMKTGISRVVRSILLALIAAPPSGYRIEPVYADGVSGRYRYARRFALMLTGAEALSLEDAPIAHRPGDIFLGLDLAPGATTQNAAVLADMRNHGIALHFVVYDMLPLLQPDAFAYGSNTYFQRHVETIAQQADSLVCISRAVADELADWLEAHPPQRAAPLRISYFHLGADLAASAPSTGVPDDAQRVLTQIAQRPSLLMVGTVEPRKGHEQALAACELLWSRQVGINLVIVGKPGWLVERLIRKIEKHPQLDKQLFWLRSASDEVLTRLYESCSALLAASTGEGFGLPLIEAARYGLPIIARNLPVFREVGAQHAYYFDAADADALAAAMTDWLALQAAGQAPSSSGMPWLNWEQSTQQLLAVVLGQACHRSVAGVPPPGS